MGREEGSGPVVLSAAVSHVLRGHRGPLACSACEGVLTGPTVTAMAPVPLQLPRWAMFLFFSVVWKATGTYEMHCEDLPPC